MRLFFVNRFFYPDHSATSQILTDLVFHLSSQGREVAVFTSRQLYDNPKAGLPHREMIRGARIYRIWSTCFGRAHLAGRFVDYATFYLLAAWCLVRTLARGDVVVAKTDPPLLSVVAALVAKLRGAVLINWIQDLFPEVAANLKVGGARFISGPLMCLRNMSLKSARINVVLGERMARHLGREGINGKKLRVIHNWSDGEVIKPIPNEENELRKCWDLAGKFVVEYSGNMGRAHEFKTILDAAEILKGEKDLIFLFIGGGPKLGWIQEEVRKRGFSNFIFKPYQSYESLADSLGVADVHLISLLPELEGLIVPSKFYGIAAAGRPTLFVGDPDGEIPRILVEEKCGYAVPVGDSAMLAARIMELCENVQLRKQMGSNARAVFERRFDKKIALQAWEEVLENAANAV